MTAATGSATGFKLADVRAVWAALSDAYKPTASWVMSPSAFASLANLTDTAGALVLPSLHAATPTLYARPVYDSPELPAAARTHAATSVISGSLHGPPRHRGHERVEATALAQRGERLCSDANCGRGATRRWSALGLLEVNPPSAAHVLAVFGILPPAYRLPLLTLDATGMCVGELEALPWGCRRAELPLARHAAQRENERRVNGSPYPTWSSRP